MTKTTRRYISLLILISVISSPMILADEMSKMEKVISEYYAYKANCRVNADIETEIMIQSVNSHLDILRVNPKLLYTDTLLKVRIHVCNIKAHNYVWMRKLKSGDYRITFLGPVTRMDQLYSLYSKP